MQIEINNKKIKEYIINTKKEEREVKNNKKGISLIVLVITIIVMIILASSVMISLSNTGIINKAHYAIDASNKQEVETLVQMIWAEEYLETDGKINRSKLEEKIKIKLGEQGVNLDKYEIGITETGIELKDLDETNWEFGYTYTNETWSTKKTKTEGELTGDIIVKFYKTGKLVDPAEEPIEKYLFEALDESLSVSLEENDAYRMVIYGTGDMGMLMTLDMSVAYAWQQETLSYIKYLKGEIEEEIVPIIPYVTEAVIGNEITNISINAFTGATSLTAIYGGKGLEEIEESSFGCAENLTTITIPASLRKIGINEFWKSSKITNIHVESLEAWNNTIIEENHNAKAFDVTITYDYRTEVERLANEGWLKAYSEGKRTASKLQTAVNNYLENNISSQELSMYNIKATTSGVEIIAKETTLGNIITSGLDYGKTINYTANGINNWQVLYKKTVDGEEYVYIIASENAPNSSLPDLPGATKNGKNIYWGAVPTTQANISRPKLWMAEWEEEGDDDHKYSTNPNGRIVAYFLDEQYWNAFKNTKYGTNVEGAIGTPTAEMLTASYNERSRALGDTADNSTLTLTKDTYGYSINNTNALELSRVEKLYTGRPNLGETTRLASPAYNGSTRVMSLNNNGLVAMSLMDHSLGVRPVVCLKSSIPAYIGLSTDGTDVVLK